MEIIVPFYSPPGRKLSLPSRRPSMRACASGLAWRHLGASRRLAPLSRQKTTIPSPHDRPLSKEREPTPKVNPNELDEHGKLHLGCNRIRDASVEAVPPYLTRLQELSTLTLSPTLTLTSSGERHPVKGYRACGVVGDPRRRSRAVARAVVEDARPSRVWHRRFPLSRGAQPQEPRMRPRCGRGR